MSSIKKEEATAAPAVVGIVDDNVQSVFDLLVAQTQGDENVTIKTVEKAVSQVLSGTVQPDEDDYDNVEETTALKEEANNEPMMQEVTWTGPMATVEELTKDGSDEDPFDALPMGQQAKNMMVTFGDGPTPSIDVVQAALLGTCRMLQLAIQDARGLRREMKAEYDAARRRLKLSNRNLKAVMLDDKSPFHVSASTASTNDAYLFRAMEKMDRLAYHLKCGFDVEQLQELYPEEMMAYNRWNQMHEEAQRDAQEEAAAAAAAADGATATKEDAKEEDPTADPSSTTSLGGHLKERAANFDARTKDMKDEWYLKTFSSVRRGSFLPHRTRATSSEEQEWNRRNVENRGRGRMTDGTWETMNIITVKFLHWIGFDPQSELPPPKEETTEALGYLGHDFMGRIVETAIRLRLGNSNNNRATTAADNKLELPAGEQLTLRDIQRSLNDSSIKPIPLYSATSTKNRAAAQLYFGPGFERRMEREMDE